uniref:Plastid light harvesting protein n=1 Tax=Eucampia antarctica TaxID=49252 RepID=A0A7S2WN16_9STRA|mmetsp:Transcript_6969/g.6610  ORF Transcript_6969/g.6610 Transcript_6969/m.6610 type:complete len:231 (+) Transcript_6969:87-779(+)|eukprot:CAMPEP_0197829172 /NCGR_PEP_ID=MMETSP1437-20131217/5619_1 /TAXON_ID=49252 ORGANISM="Eucampia antarctica, Strain CCMP1452" /NCGR_SAMPLE_ID=MMETSP1437 /ASSEMBLY_ACC=CAM_ASM_001096 /LENGTH=230 /DNA_ID=CAMNT_0043430705 /DNA_START=82 /DNA_END=774 /DNA_ORIENTATION=-
MKVIAALALLGSASAFAPAGVSTTRPAMVANKMSAVDEAFGVSVETGNRVPPLGRALLENAQPSAVKWFQNAEIKHGRIAMVATIGFLSQKLGVHFPLYFGPTGSNCFSPASDQAWLLSKTTGVTFSDIAAAAPLDAVKMVPLSGWAQIFFGAAVFECVAYHRQWNLGAEIPGDYGYDPLGFTQREGGWDSKELTKLRMMEIKNGRVAMMTIAAWVSNEMIPGALPVWHP